MEKNTGGLWLTLAAAAGVAAGAYFVFKKFRADSMSGVEDLVSLCDAAVRKLEDRVGTSDYSLQAG